MVEYVLLTVGTALQTMAATATTWIADIPWIRVGYAALALVALRLLWRALTGARASGTR